MAEQPHIMVFPFPAQGHVNPFLSLAQLLCHAGLQVTFLNTEHNHSRLSHRDVLSASFPTLHFDSIPDGLPTDHPRSDKHIGDLFFSFQSFPKQIFRDLLHSIKQSSDPRPPVTCIIADGIISFALDVAEELGIRIITFRTISACSFWTYFCLPKLVENGELPFPDDNMDTIVIGVSGVETGLLRRRDLPSFCRSMKESPSVFEFFVKHTQDLTRSSAFILNTFEELEAPILSQLVAPFPKIYTIGPIHSLLRQRLGDDISHSGHLRKEDRSCMTWLDSKPLRSVIYVSFGSLVSLTREDLLEFWHGLVNSGKNFLWIVRSYMTVGADGEYIIPEELQLGTKERGFLVDWAPQEEVLGHCAVGGFLTHSGWNSTIEGIKAGVPMLCWPKLADQQVNSRWVSEVWKIGLDMKDMCNRSTVAKMIKLLMEDKKGEIRRSMDEISKLSNESVSEGGSSYRNLEKLIEDLRQI
ncbi:hypothetical protein UlMin_000364 [Ulmus minor]